MTECLILGQSGIGKTSLVAELVNRGCLAYDADDNDCVPGLSGWFDVDGRPCDYNNDPAWRAEHQFLWDMPTVRDLAEARDRSRPLYFAGTAQNDLRAVQFFTHTVALDATVEAYCQRRASENRAARYPVDNSNEHKAWLMEVLPGLRIAWRALGIVVLDTTYISTSQVADRVTALVDLCAPAKT